MRAALQRLHAPATRSIHSALHRSTQRAVFPAPLSFQPTHSLGASSSRALLLSRSCATLSLTRSQTRIMSALTHRTTGAVPLDVVRNLSTSSSTPTGAPAEAQVATAQTIPPQPAASSSSAATVAAAASTLASSASSSLPAAALPPVGGSWWSRWTHEDPLPPRFSRAWWAEMALICTVFGVTGSSSMYLVKPLIKDVFAVEGSLKDGPWSYRALCVLVLMPAYSLLLVSFGTLAGRHHYFKRQALRMWGRILPLDKLGIRAKPPPPPLNAAKPSGTPPSNTPCA